MNAQEVVQYESEGVRPRQALIAGVAAALLLIAPILSLTGVHAKVDELTVDLLEIHKRFPLDLIAAVIQGGGLVALALTLGWLGDRAQQRSVMIKAWTRWLAIAGASLFAIGVIGGEVSASIASNKFATTGAQTYLQANKLTGSGLITIMPLVEQLGALMLCVGVIFIALNAMRVGLLPRNIGYVGVAAGALVLFPILPIPVVQCFWLAVLAVIFAGRWPAGDPPAWSSGEAVPWPMTARQERAAAGAQRRAELRGQRQAGRGAARGGGRGLFSQPPRQAPPSRQAPPEPSGTTVPGRTRASTPKRKRKQR